MSGRAPRPVQADLPDAPMRKRGASWDTLTNQIRNVAAARRSLDEPACRMELRKLSDEARLLAAQDPLPP